MENVKENLFISRIEGYMNLALFGGGIYKPCALIPIVCVKKANVQKVCMCLWKSKDNFLRDSLKDCPSFVVFFGVFAPSHLA